jgi:hypothetical protein
MFYVKLSKKYEENMTYGRGGQTFFVGAPNYKAYMDISSRNYK